MSDNKILSAEILIKKMIDRLQGLASTVGLSNTPYEEVVITNMFLYKFLNDKFEYLLENYAKDENLSVEQIVNDENEYSLFVDSLSGEVIFNVEDRFEYLVENEYQGNLHELLDDALTRISENELNELFMIEQVDGSKTKLFQTVTDKVGANDRLRFARNLITILKEEKFDKEVFENGFDFYATIFEYLIKNYNVSSGKYAEYFTPQATSKIIAKCLVHNEDLGDKMVDIYDPSSGSGSLLLHLANALGLIVAYDGALSIKRANVYTQDISQKSSNFLRLNLMLNGLSRSMQNVKQGDTLLEPAHFEDESDKEKGLKKFDYIVSNPPFKTDFSSSRDEILNTPFAEERFASGLPEIPKTKKDSMAIYTAFIQHVMYSLKDDGKGAIVVPTGFITANSGIEAKIRKVLVENKWIKGVISMPSNIFANTGTNVSILFLDKTPHDSVYLMDASNMGKKVKDGKSQRTILNDDEVNLIIDSFTNKKEVEDIGKSVPFEKIEEKNNSLSYGQYYEVKLEFVEKTHEQFLAEQKEFLDFLSTAKTDSNELLDNIMSTIQNMDFK